MSTKPGSNFIAYTIVIVIAAVIVTMVFMKNFQSGEQAGKATPGRPETSASNAPGLDLRALAKDDGLAAKGKTLFMTNCASCHGTKGYGDGDRAASLNPKPRNYHTEKFKFGDDIVSIFNTLQKGSPGTSMPSFALLPPEDVMAMAHYVRSLIPTPTPTTDAIIAKLPEAKAGGAAPVTPTAMMDSLFKDTGPRIPIQVAMQRLEVPPVPARATSKGNSSLPGAALFAQRCAACHGARGEGMPQRVLAVAPYRYENAAALAGSQAAWARDPGKFAEIVVHGLPGRIMPGNAALTRQQIDDLYTFVRSFSTP
jgi:mono/diheme cytochrome c family protein